MANSSQLVIVWSNPSWNRCKSWANNSSRSSIAHPAQLILDPPFGLTDWLTKVPRKNHHYPAGHHSIFSFRNFDCCLWARKPPMSMQRSYWCEWKKNWCFLKQSLFVLQRFTASSPRSIDSIHFSSLLIKVSPFVHCFWQNFMDVVLALIRALYIIMHHNISKHTHVPRHPCLLAPTWASLCYDALS